MAFLKLKIKRHGDSAPEVRAYAYDSHMAEGCQKQFSVHAFGPCRDKADAQERFNKWLITYKRSKRQKRPSPLNPTLREFAPVYLDRNEQLTGSKHQSKSSLKHLIRHLGRHPLHQISRRVVLDYRDTRKAEVIKTKGRNNGNLPSPKTINHELSTLSSVIRKALELEQVKDHPFLKYGLSLRRNFFLKVTQVPRPALTRQEFISLMKNIPEERSRVITFLYAITGMRQGELINLRLKDIDLDQNRITFRSPKTADFRTLAIPGVLKPLFEKLLTHVPLRTGWQERYPYQREYILCNQRGGQQKTPGKDFLTQAAQRAGIPKHVTPHILRHSFGSHAANLVNIWELKELMGHKNVTTTEIYVKTFKAPNLETANRIASSFGIDPLLVSAMVNTSS